MATIDDIHNDLVQIARQLGNWNQSQVNIAPIPTTTVSPKVTGATLSVTTAIIIATISTTRHGLAFHNPGTTNIYIYPLLSANGTAGTSNVYLIPINGTNGVNNFNPSTSFVGGTILVAPGGTFSMPVNQYPNLSSGWAGFSAAGSNQPVTVVEFF